MYKDRGSKYAGKLGGDEQYLDSSDPGSEDTDNEVDEEDGVHNPQPRRYSSRVYFDPACKKICFQLEMVFENVKQFKSALQDYAVQRRVQIKLRPNEQHRVRATCVNSTRCRWHILGSLEGHTGNFIVKSYYPVHKCFRATRNKMANTAWVAKHFKDKIINQLDIKLRQLQDLIRIKYGVYVGKSICARAKHQVMGQYLGDYKKEFARIYDYADQLRSTNPGSTVIVKTSKETIPGKEVFVGIYICLHACKVGWLEGCRNVIGFDGAFLKGVCKGELLSCIAKDGNNQMYPVAWAVLTESQGEGVTIISDMQKGLVASVSELLPNVEHRMCARHIWSNWKQKWKGEERRKKFWACARASFEAYLKAKIDELAELGDSKIIEELLRYPKQCWCRALFKDWSKYDSVEKNMCETFNS
ncbi:PREDICTED: uncharacterized protein LOC109216384 [Nicotiana attenuata]|uniref:uncharacterized protein LOC109216384 n=1 Tax=Nicotiana attenuata TaxID=49451 RepID=UPI000905C0EC|nr:PREDICTED: uncharacterized protein LOC109216384 [Nicotiana attenuata]